MKAPGWFRSWLNSKLSFALHDFDVSELGIGGGRVQLTNVRLSAGMLELLSDHLCSVAPIIVEEVSIRKLGLQLSLSRLFDDPVGIHLEGVVVSCKMQSAAYWDVGKVYERCRAAKLRELDLHTRVARFGATGGDGFLHNFVALALDSLEASVLELTCTLTDEVSLSMGSASRAFILGGGFERAELSRSGCSSAAGGCVLRCVSVQRPLVFVDPVVRQDVAASSKFVGPAEDDSPRRQAVSRDWILRPSDEAKCDLYILQSRRPTTVAAREASHRSGVVSEHDFAELSVPLHGASSASRLAGLQLPLPRSGLILSAGQVHLELAHSHVESMVGLLSYVLLGYGAVIQGAVAGSSEAPPAEEADVYGRQWFQKALGESGVNLGNEVEAFERAYPLDVCLSAREEALRRATPQQTEEPAFLSEQGLFTACFPGKNASRNSDSHQATWEHAVADLSRQHPDWQQSWRQLIRSQSPVILLGLCVRSATVDVIVPDDAGRLDRTTGHLSGAGCLRFKVEETRGSWSRDVKKKLLQVSLTSFSVADGFGARKLQALSQGRGDLRLAASPILVQPAPRASGRGQAFRRATVDGAGEGGAHAVSSPSLQRRESSPASPRGSVDSGVGQAPGPAASSSAPAHSELYFGMTRCSRPGSGSSEEPDGVLQMKSLGELQICLPLTQLLLLCLPLCPASTLYLLSRALTGKPWRSAASREVLETAAHGQEASRRLWARAMDRQSDSWELDVDLEPITVFLPLPGAGDGGGGETDWGPDGWKRTYHICMGRAFANSRLQSKRLDSHEGPAVVRSGAERSGDKTGVCYSRFEDVYHFHVKDLTIKRLAATASSVPAVECVLMSPTAAQVMLHLCHWSAVEIPQAMLVYQVPSLELLLEAEDTESIVSTAGEVLRILGVATSKADASADETRSESEFEMEDQRSTLDRKRASASHHSARLRRSRISSSAQANSTDEVFLEQEHRKLWDFVVLMSSVRVRVRLPGPECINEDALELLAGDQKVQCSAGLDGCMSWACSVRHLEVGHRLFAGFPLLTSHALSRQEQEKKGDQEGDRGMALALSMNPAEAAIGAWMLQVQVAIHRPVVLLWWPLVKRVLVSIAYCVRQESSTAKTASPSAKHDADDEESNGQLSPLIRLGGDNARPRLIPLVSLLLSVSLQGAELLLPTAFSDCSDAEELSSPKRKSPKTSLTSPTPPACSGRKKLWVCRMGTTLELNVNTFSEDGKVQPDILFRLHARQTFADFVRTKERRLQKRAHLERWWRGANPLPLLVPSRATVQSRMSRMCHSKICVEPIQICIYPCTRPLLLGLASAGMELAREVLELWDPLLASAGIHFLSTDSSDEPIALPARRFSEDSVQRLQKYMMKLVADSSESVASRMGSLRGMMFLNTELQVAALLVRMADLPGKVEPLWAEFAVEDLLVSLRTSFEGGRHSQTRWVTKLSATGHFDVLDALSLQVQPVMEPVELRWHLRGRGGAASGQLPQGGFSASWLNINLPVGVFYAARLWLRAERRFCEDEGTAPVAAAVQVENSEDEQEQRSAGRAEAGARQDQGPGAAARSGAEAGSHANTLGFPVVNALGEPLAVRLLDDEEEEYDEPLYRESAEHWCRIEPLDRDSASGSGVSDAHSLIGLHRQSHTVSSVPPLAMRCCLNGQLFEFEMRRPLKVPQFEMVRLRIPLKERETLRRGTMSRAVTSQKRGEMPLTLLLRAVPSPGGQGCALLVCSSALMRNTTDFTVTWSFPELTAKHGTQGTAAQLRINERGAWEGDDMWQPQDEEEEGAGDDPAIFVWRFAGVEPLETCEWTPDVSDRGTGRVSDSRRASAMTHGSSLSSQMDVGHFDGAKHEEVLASGRRINLPLAWLLACQDRTRAGGLCVGVPGSPSRGQVLPPETLRKLVSFDFLRPHSEEAARTPLAGSLVKLVDERGEPRHLCVTLTLGLLGDKACCLELVVSSCALIVNNLPNHISVYSGELDNPLEALELDATQSGKLHLAVDEIRVKLESCIAAVPLHGSKPVKQNEFRRIHALPQIGSTKDTTRDHHEEGMRQTKTYSLMVRTSSAFEADRPALQLGLADAWLEAFTFIHPSTWITYRRAVTIYIQAWIENFSTVDVWVRPAGVRGVPGRGAELNVPPGSRILLPSAWTHTGKMRVSVEQGQHKKFTAPFRWGSQNAMTATELRCRSERRRQEWPLELDDGDVESCVAGPWLTFLSVTVSPASVPYSESQVIRLFDSVTLLNLSSESLFCWIPGGSLQSRGRGRCCGSGASVLSMVEDVEDRFSATVKPNAIQRIDGRLGVLRFQASALQGGITEGTASTRSAFHSSRGPVRKPLEVGLEHAMSFQVRCRSKFSDDGELMYSNLRVSVKKLHHGAATLVMFEDCEPAFVICNETSTKVTVRQKGVVGESEALKPGQRRPFQWYDPGGTLQLVAEPSGLQRRISESSLSHIDSRSNSSRFRSFTAGVVGSWPISKDIDTVSGQEVARIMTPQRFNETIKRNTSIFREESEALSEAGKRAHLQFRFEGLGIALSDASPLQLAYASMDRLTVNVSPSSAVQGDAAPPEGRSAVRRDSTAQRKLAKAARKAVRSGWSLPPMDITITLLNLQVDSYIPGSFYPCVIRPFRGRFQLWRSLEMLSPARLSRPLRSPVLKAEVVGCRWTGPTLILTSCHVALDRFVTSIDEALLVSLCAYYCRVACYFDLPPFEPAEQRNAEDIKRQGSTSFRTPSKESDTRLLPMVGASERSTAQAQQARQSGLVRIEDTLRIDEMTYYLSMSLLESTNPYLEGLQRDAQVGVLLRSMMPFYSAAVFQPQMLHAQCSQYLGRQLCMPPGRLAHVLKEQCVAPIVRRLIFLLFFSFDWLGNPLQLLLGVAAGLLQLGWQPYKRGLIGIPLGIYFCLCSVGGSLVDSLSRILDAAFKSMERMQRWLYSVMRVQKVRRARTRFSIDMAPTNFMEGLHLGLRMAIAQCYVDLSNAREVCFWFAERVRQSWWKIPKLFVLCLAFILLLVVMLILDILKVVCLFLRTALQGVVSSLYRRSADEVSSMDPLQLFALELPLRVRPAQDMQDTLDVFAEGGIAAPFAYLPSLAHSQLDSQDVADMPWRLPGSDNKTEVVLAAFWCGGLATAEGETSVLVQTDKHVSLLHVSGWGGVSADGRPSRPRASYRWIWKLLLSEIAWVDLIPPKISALRLKSKEASSGITPEWRMEFGIAGAANQRHARAVQFSSKAQAFRAFELLAPVVTHGVSSGASFLSDRMPSIRSEGSMTSGSVPRW